MMKNREKHHFSFYFSELSAVKISSCVITNSVFIHRLVTIMRYQIGDTFVLFNRDFHREVTISTISKKEVVVTCGNIINNKKIEPEIILFLPVLKKESLEEGVYNAVVAGVTHIQLIITEKCHRKSITSTERQRLEKIIIAACEQSKQYVLPMLQDPLLLNDACAHYKEYRIYYADFDGSVLTKVADKSVIMVGPEGDLTSEEKEFIRTQKAYFFLLTPTVLRSQEAVLVAIAHARML